MGVLFYGYLLAITAQSFESALCGAGSGWEKSTPVMGPGDFHGRGPS